VVVKESCSRAALSPFNTVVYSKMIQVLLSTGCSPENDISQQMHKVVAPADICHCKLSFLLLNAYPNQRNPVLLLAQTQVTYSILQKQQPTTRLKSTYSYTCKTVMEARISMSAHRFAVRQVASSKTFHPTIVRSTEGIKDLITRDRK
jgi:hypothetical protein